MIAAAERAFRRRAIALELERRRRTVTGTEPLFLSWCQRVSPHLVWTWRQQVAIAEKLQRVEDGLCKRLIINAPVRHGKSVEVSQHFPARYLRKFPAHNVIVGSYGATLAEKFSRRARALARFDGLALNPERQAADDWETAEGGGLRAVGVGGGVTGQGGHLIIVDDPHKSRREAESAIEREKVWDWWTNDLYTRCEPNGAIVLTMARWHKDDLTGRLLEQDGGDTWEVLHLPAVAEEDDPLGRAVGEALCPERYDAIALQRIRESIGEYAFLSLFQGNPIARSGGMFEPYGWAVLESAPVCEYYVRYWDTAGTKKNDAKKSHDPDYTAGVLIGMRSDRKPVVVDVQRFRVKVAERDAKMEAVARRDYAVYQGNVVQWVETEAGVSGEDRTKAIIARLAGLRVQTERPTGDKQLRAEPFASQGQAGNVSLVAGEWNDPFCAELADFPTGKHDDQCLIGETLIHTSRGTCRLDAVQVGELVLGRTGWVRVLAAFSSGVKPVVYNGPLVGTANHPIYADGGWFPLGQVTDTMLVLTLCPAPLKVARGPCSPRGSAECTTSGNTVARRSALLGRCARSLAHHARSAAATAWLPIAAGVRSITSDGSATATPQRFARPREAAFGWKASSFRGSSSAATPIRHGQRTGGISSHQASTSSAASNRSTEKSGRAFTARFLTGLRSIIRTPTPLTTVPRTWGWCRSANISSGTLTSGDDSGSRPSSGLTLHASARPHQLGTGRRKDVSGTGNTRCDVGSESAEVFNLTTSDGTYFANGVLVHNCDAAGAAFNKLAEMAAQEWGTFEFSV